MKIAVLHGQRHQGSTWYVTHRLLEKLAEKAPVQLEEFWFNDAEPCVGCYSCFLKGEETCPHYGQNKAAMEALEAADLIVAESPNYVMGMTGQLKIFMDHMAYRWMSHRPSDSMFGKVGVAIATTAGTGAGRVTGDIARQFFYWGVAKTHRLPLVAAAMGQSGIPEDKKAKIERETDRLAAKILGQVGRARPGPKTKAIFTIMRAMHKGNDWTPLDKAHWQAQGWFGPTRPWK